MKKEETRKELKKGSNKLLDQSKKNCSFVKFVSMFEKSLQTTQKCRIERFRMVFLVK